MKYFFSLISFFLAIIIPRTSEAVFSDAPSSHPYYDSISWAQSQKIVNGYADGTFRPDATINRIELIKILVGSNFTPAGIMQCDPTHMYSFADARYSEWYSKYLCIAAQHRIVEGYSDNTFHPEQPINYVETAKLIAIISQFKNGVRSGNGQYFSVLPGQEWYEPYVDFLKGKNAIPASINKNEQFVTRGEVVEMMYRLSDAFHTPDTEQDNWKTYEDAAGIFTLQLPSDWLAVNSNDNALLPFTKLLNGAMTYAPSSRREWITLQVFKKEGENESIHEIAALDIIGSGDYQLRSREQNGYMFHSLTPPDAPGDDDPDRYYTLFEHEDGTVIALSYPISSTIRTVIENSFRFIPKDILR